MALNSKMYGEQDLWIVEDNLFLLSSFSLGLSSSISNEKLCLKGVLCLKVDLVDRN